ncbi:FAD binding domain-containing protein [Pseudooceanicola algae]|nr:FAD binding domain-containing protein [Pseudooceanicola algae]
MYNFEFVKPTSIEEAVAALADEEAQPLSGGQTLIPTMKQRLNAPGVLVSLLGIEEMRHVGMEGDLLTVGAATSHAEIARLAATSYPALAALAGQIGDPAVRSRGTIGGSLANNDPAACYPAAALASAAVIVTDRREIAADDFFEGMFTTALEEGEIVTAVRFPIPEGAAYVKFEQPASRFAMTGVFIARFASGVRVAVTGASEEGVFRWAEAENALSADFSRKAIADLSLPAEGMMSDLHGSAEYRAHLVKVMTGRAVAAA